MQTEERMDHLTQVQIGTKGGLISYVVRVSCSALLLRSSRSLAGDFSKGAIKSLIGILLEFANYQPLPRT